jgi:hypothetical protein
VRYCTATTAATPTGVFFLNIITKIIVIVKRYCFKECHTNCEVWAAKQRKSIAIEMQMQVFSSFGR